jgi:hypothetical protein
MDTRSGLGGEKGPLANDYYALPFAGTNGIPSKAIAVALNLTATGTVGDGLFALDPGSTDLSSLNYAPGRTVANSAIVPVDPNGTFDICDSGNPNTSAQAIIDVDGYFAPGAGAGHQPIPLDRILNTTGATQQIDVYNQSAGSTDIILDVFGYFANSRGRPEPPPKRRRPRITKSVQRSARPGISRPGASHIRLRSSEATASAEGRGGVRIIALPGPGACARAVPGVLAVSAGQAAVEEGLGPGPEVGPGVGEVLRNTSR